MIFIEKTIDQWVVKYPLLIRYKYVRCTCGKPAKNFRPWRTKHYAGLKADTCECGRAGVNIAAPA